MDQESTQEIWQVESGGHVVGTSFDEMTEWINEGTLLRIDRVRKGNLRWTEAGKVPQLVEFFNAKDAEDPIKPIVTTTAYKAAEREGIDRRGDSDRRTAPGYRRTNRGRRDADGTPATAFSSATAAAHGSPSIDPLLLLDVCSIHPEMEAAYHCDTCGNVFCNACPNSYGGSVKICPFCGAMCKSLAELVKEHGAARDVDAALGASFGFGDFSRAIAFPFRFKTSLFFGAVMFMFFTLGQGAVAFGGIFMLAAAIFCFMLANTLTFGVLANTVENFSQGKLDLNFMPSFDDFSLWDDVVHPFFLSIGVYISSWGPFLVVMVVAFFMILKAASGDVGGLKSDGARAINPDIPYAANTASQADKMREMLNQQAEIQKNRIAQMDNVQNAPDPASLAKEKQHQEDEFFEITNRLIEDQRKSQLESVVGKAPDTIAKERDALVKKVMGFGVLFLIFGGLTMLWGLFYFPAACAVAGYTRSFTATLNPTVGLDTIRRLGSSYVLILVMGFLLVIASMVVGGVLGMIFLPFDMPGVGNVPVKAIGALFGFYISVVFSCILGYALFKAADRLELPR